MEIVNDKQQANSKSGLPDVSAAKQLETAFPLHWVGMQSIDLPIKIYSFETALTLIAKIDVYVNLKANATRGIHMSRLFSEIQNNLANQLIEWPKLQMILQNILATHQDLSDKAKIVIKFAYPKNQKSLLSHNSGWRTYPITIEGVLDKEFQQKIDFEILYSSTCPASAALSRKANAAFLKENFSDSGLTVEKVSQWMEQEENTSATPHAQRSLAKIEIETDNLDLSGYIDQIENCLGTPVQSTVKREDEQEFAKLNAKNLMFCEDAARKVYSLLKSDPRIKSFKGEFRHLESLHAHDAVAIIQG